MFTNSDVRIKPDSKLDLYLLGQGAEGTLSARIVPVIKNSTLGNFALFYKFR